MKLFDKKILCLVATCTLVIAGCNRKEEPKEEVAEQTPPVNMLLPNCDDASVKNALVRELSKNVENDIALYVTDYVDAGDLELDRRISERLPEIGIDLQNVSSKDDACQTELHITLPANDISLANQHFIRTGEQSVAERVIDTGTTLNDNRLIAPITYRINNDTVVLTDKPNILSLVAQISTAATYRMAKGENKNISISRPSTYVPQPTTKPRPTPAVNVQSTATPIAAQESQDPLAQEYAKQNGIRIETSNNTSNTPPTSSEQANEQTTQNEQPSQPSQNEATQKPTNQEKTTPKPTPVTDTSSEITIIETDETY